MLLVTSFETDANIFWAQLGLQSQEAEQILREAGRNKNCDESLY